MKALFIILLAVVMCFCIFNYWFQKEKYNRLTAQEKSRLNSLNSPGAWLSYFLVSFIATLIFISYYIYNLYLAIFEMR